MHVHGDYDRDGFALVSGVVPREVCRALLARLKQDVEALAPFGTLAQGSALLRQPAPELYGFHYPPLLAFLWGLTPTIAGILGRDILPSYAYFRLYRESDVCYVHSDRMACEISLSLTLDYSDGVPWALELAETATVPEPRVEPDFGSAPFRAIEMAPGDGVLYQGVTRRHGRTTPNPNLWSAHLFCHWVARDGEFASHAFDGNADAARPVNFTF